MPNNRSLLFFALVLVAFLLWQAWDQDYGVKPAASVASTAQAPATSSAMAVAGSTGEVPDATHPAAQTTGAAATPTPPAAGASANAPAPTVTVQTDVLRVEISTRGGSIVRAELLAYPRDAAKRHEPVRLFDDSSHDWYVAQSGLVATHGAAPDHETLLQADTDTYRLGDAQSIDVPLHWQDANGLKFTKVFTFTRGSYLIGARMQLENAGTQPWTGNAYRQLQRVAPAAAKGFNDPERYAYVGAAWYSPSDKFQKLPFDKFAKEPLHAQFAGGWVAMMQHYFFSAWIPDKSALDTYSSAIVDSAAGVPRYLVRAVSPPLSIAPGASQTLQAHLYVGPTLLSQLDAIGKAGIAQNLALTADYGMLTFIAQPMHWILLKLHAVVGNWGLAIILLVLLIKLALFKVSEAQYRSMAKMKKLQPRMQALKERYGDDKQKLSAATMELYQKEKINPLGGCVPTLIQIPVFFALYYVLLESVELRHAPFFGWIQNLSAPDPYFILPVLNAAIMVGAQWLSPASPGMDATQAKMMKYMPIAFSVLFLFFPAGLVLYYAVNGGLSLLQQWIITRRMQTADAKVRAG